LSDIQVKAGLFAEALKQKLAPLRYLATPLNGFLVGVLLALAGYASVQIVPVYIKSYELSAAARRAAQLAAVDFQSNQAIQGAIYDKAQELGLPVQMNQIQVQSTVSESVAGSIETLMDPAAADHVERKATLKIEVSYSVPVEFPGWELRLKFHLHADDRST
jgi:hypothetical protein